MTGSHGSKISSLLTSYFVTRKSSSLALWACSVFAYMHTYTLGVGLESPDTIHLRYLGALVCYTSHRNHTYPSVVDLEPLIDLQSNWMVGIHKIKCGSVKERMTSVQGYSIFSTSVMVDHSGVQGGSACSFTLEMQSVDSRERNRVKWRDGVSIVLSWCVCWQIAAVPCSIRPFISSASTKPFSFLYFVNDAGSHLVSWHGDDLVLDPIWCVGSILCSGDQMLLKDSVTSFNPKIEKSYKISMSLDVHLSISYTNKSSRDNNRLDASLHNFHRKPVIWK